MTRTHNNLLATATMFTIGLAYCSVATAEAPSASEPGIVQGDDPVLGGIYGQINQFNHMLPQFIAARDHLGVVNSLIGAQESYVAALEAFVHASDDPIAAGMLRVAQQGLADLRAELVATQEQLGEYHADLLTIVGRFRKWYAEAEMSYAGLLDDEAAITANRDEMQLKYEHMLREFRSGSHDVTQRLLDEMRMAIDTLDVQLDDLATGIESQKRIMTTVSDSIAECEAANGG